MNVFCNRIRENRARRNRDRLQLCDGIVEGLVSEMGIIYKSKGFLLNGVQDFEGNGRYIYLNIGIILQISPEFGNVKGVEIHGEKINIFEHGK